MALDATDVVVVDDDPLGDDFWWFEILASPAPWSPDTASDRHVDVIVTRHPGVGDRTRRLMAELAAPGHEPVPYDLEVNGKISYRPVMRDMIRMVAGMDKARYIPAPVMTRMLHWLTIDGSSAIVSAHDLRQALLSGPQVLNLTPHP